MLAAYGLVLALVACVVVLTARSAGGYAVVSFGGFLGIGAEEHAVPWNKLTYDVRLSGYRTDITEQELRGAPTFARDPHWNEPPTSGMV
jgi:hypothetical protein